ncbi:MAG: hypothetical protein ACXV2D_05025 [Halobacteriota archaeon]
MSFSTKERKKRRPIVSGEELFLADEKLKARLPTIKKPLKNDKKIDRQKI